MPIFPDRPKQRTPLSCNRGSLIRRGAHRHLAYQLNYSAIKAAAGCPLHKVGPHGVHKVGPHEVDGKAWCGLHEVHKVGPHEVDGKHGVACMRWTGRHGMACMGCTCRDQGYGPHYDMRWTGGHGMV